LEWAATTGLPDDAGIDYYLGEADLVGRDAERAVIAAFSAGVLARSA
jgi:hypothetical protein